MISNVKILLFLLGVIPQILWAQSASSDSTVISSAMRAQRESYMGFIGANSALYNGTEYKETVIGTYDVGMPFFLSTNWYTGSLEYDGQRYENVDLQFDIMNNKVIIHPFYSSIRVELIYSRVSRFTIDGHTFVKLEKITGTDNFYDELVNGPIKLYALRRKELRWELSTGMVVRVYDDKAKLFLLKENDFIPIKNKGAFFKALPESKSAIKKYLNEKNIGFHKNLEGALTRGLTYYNTLIKD